MDGKKFDSFGTDSLVINLHTCMLRTILFSLAFLVVCLAGPIQTIIVGEPPAKFEVDEDSFGQKYGWMIWLGLNLVGLALAFYCGMMGG